MNRLILSLILGLCSLHSLNAQTIAEKKMGLQKNGLDLGRDTQSILKEVNQSLSIKKSILRTLYANAMQLYNQGANPDNFKALLGQINGIRIEIAAEENEWRERAVQNGQTEDYALWHQPETTIEQLIIDYGSQEYVYLMTPEIASIKLSVNSNIPIPREAWSELLELILTQNGIGIRQLNPYLRELYQLNENQNGLKFITNKREDLDFFPPEARIGFMLSPAPTEVRRIWMFLDKFVNPNTTLLQVLGRDILIVAPSSEIRDLLKLYDFVVTNHHDHQYKLIPLRKVRAEEMAQMLSALFDQALQGPPGHRRIPPPPPPGSKSCIPPPRPERDFCDGPESNGLKIIVMSGMSQALFLVGTPEEICRAEHMINDVENQIGNAREKVVYWYVAKHAVPEELAEMLSRIYNIMVEERILIEDGCCNDRDVNVSTIIEERPTALFKYPEQLYQEDFYQSGAVAVNPAPITLVPTRERRPPNEGRDNFIVDAKTGTLVMVVEEDLLPKLLEVIKKLDVPVKMVQIEVLLFEKRVREQTNYGLNLLRIGSAASQTHYTGLTYNDIMANPLFAGITYFLISRPKESGIPAYDLAYSFLLSQTDVTINSCPSVLTLNQTPARIALVEEFSINTGIFQVETAKGVTLENAYTRSQYGITLEITPTIHLMCDQDVDDSDVNYITLETNVNFDTIQGGLNPNDRPVIIRRNIANEVLIPDGQTVILGGLRRKNSLDTREGIPYLAEIPGIGKLFSTVTMGDDKTDMYIFITPKIICDPVDDLLRVRCEELALRPGDIPAFLERLEVARELERTRIFAQSMNILCGRAPERAFLPSPPNCPCVPISDMYESYNGEYDGR